MPVLPPTTLHHLRITVTDLKRSEAFYTEVLGFEVAARSSGDPTDPTVRSDPDQLFGGVLFSANGILFGIRPSTSSDQRFQSERVGLDHVSFGVAGRGDLDRAAASLADRQIPHGEIKELPAFGLAILSFEDPDGIHLELTAPL